MSVEIVPGDMRVALAGLAACGFQCDAVVTDPPYHLTSTVERFGKPGSAPAKSNGATGVYGRASKGFMGKEWDGGDIAFRPETWRLCFDLLKPGGHLVAFGGSRTYHRIACAIEDAGFEIRDSLMWLYGQGFPKSHDVERGIAKRLCTQPGRHYERNLPEKDRRPDDHVCDACAESLEWDGWGTAIKPAYEPIILAQKPFKKTVAANVLDHGVGGINIEACRIESGESTARVQRGTTKAWEGGAFSGEYATGSDTGRFPANIMHDGSDEVMQAFAAFGEKTSGKPGTLRTSRNNSAAYGAESRQPGTQMTGFGDTGTAARFFYCAKAGKEDRAGSKHPTVKPLSLMQWLCRLVTPPGGLILDPFAGSGTTGGAARKEGFNAVLVERDPEYIEDIRRRLAV